MDSLVSEVFLEDFEIFKNFVKFLTFKEISNVMLCNKAFYHNSIKYFKLFLR